MEKLNNPNSNKKKKQYQKKYIWTFLNFLLQDNQTQDHIHKAEIDDYF